MEFQDRVSAYPNRYLITDENGNTSYVYLERADEPTVPGTPLSAETFNALIEAIKACSLGGMTAPLDMGGKNIVNVNNVVSTYLNGARVRTLGNYTSEAKNFTLQRNGFGVYLIILHTAGSDGSLGAGAMYLVTVGQNQTGYDQKKIYGEASMGVGISNANEIVFALNAYTTCLVISLDSANAPNNWDK